MLHLLDEESRIIPAGSGSEYNLWSLTDHYSTYVVSADQLSLVNTVQNWASARANFGVSSGKHYFEITFAVAYYSFIGVGNASAPLSGYPGQDLNGWGMMKYLNRKYHAGYTSLGGAGPSQPFTMSLALDMDTGKIWFAHAGVWIEGDPATGVSPSFETDITGELYPMCHLYRTFDEATANFGATAFKYPVPAGFNPGVYR